MVKYRCLKLGCPGSGTATVATYQRTLKFFLNADLSGHVVVCGTALTLHLISSSTHPQQMNALQDSESLLLYTLSSNSH